MNATKRILKDYRILDSNKEDLNKRNVHFHIDQNNINVLKVLIIPNEEPYKGGVFLFEFFFPADYPIMPPQVLFNPKQNYVRFHPNYYENGKICLSMINTWGQEDWTPAMSILSIINVLESRFDDKSIRYEPGMEKAQFGVINNNNEIIKYGKYLVLCDILEKKFNIFSEFYDIIKQYHANIQNIISELPDHEVIKRTQTPWFHSVDIDYKLIRNRLIQIIQETSFKTS